MKSQKTWFIVPEFPDINNRTFPSPKSLSLSSEQKEVGLIGSNVPPSLIFYCSELLGMFTPFLKAL